MPRTARAATTLIEQVTALRKTSRAKVEDDVDGLGVRRTVSFDKPTSKWLEPILDAIQDPRIVSTDDDKGRLVVTFSAKPGLGDSRNPFPLAEGEVIADAEKAQ